MNLSVFNVIATAVGLSGIILALISWLRGGSQDKATVVKTSAETENELASAKEKRANAETKIADAALEWAEKIGVELDKTRNICDRQKAELDTAYAKMRDCQGEFNKHVIESQNQINKLSLDLANMKVILDGERDNCIKIKAELDVYKNTISK